MVASERGDLDAAARWQSESLTGFWDVGSHESVATQLSAIAVWLARQGDSTGSARLFGAAEAFREFLGSKTQYPERALFERTEVMLRRGPAAAEVEDAWTAGRKLPLAEAVAEARAALANPSVAISNGQQDGEEEKGLLSPREMDVLRLIEAGMTNREIASALFISRRTAQGHVARILGKLDVRTRTAAVTAAHREGLLGDRS